MRWAYLSDPVLQALSSKQGANGDGCQEGNAIEARNAPFDKTGSDKMVSITDNTVTEYQKSGIVANGSVAATIRSDLACGFLIYQADGVRASGNNFFDNERNQCNFGKGGGSFEPSTP